MQGLRIPPPPRDDLPFSNTTGILFIGVEVEQDTSAPPPKKILDPPLLFQKDTLSKMLNSDIVYPV